MGPGLGPVLGPDSRYQTRTQNPKKVEPIKNSVSETDFEPGRSIEKGLKSFLADPRTEVEPYCNSVVGNAFEPLLCDDDVDELTSFVKKKDISALFLSYFLVSCAKVSFSSSYFPPPPTPQQSRFC